MLPHERVEKQIAWLCGEIRGALNSIAPSPSAPATALPLSSTDPPPLARALVNGPALHLLDEPLGALDLKLRKAMQLELKQLQEKVGITFIYVTHDQEEALTMSDPVAVMSGGEILQVGGQAAVVRLQNAAGSQSGVYTVGDRVTVYWQASDARTLPD